METIRPLARLIEGFSISGLEIAAIAALSTRLSPAASPLPIIAVCALCAPEGIEQLRAAGLSVHVVTAAVDKHLNDQAFIVPGLGDAGDRQFGPPA